MYGKNRAHIHCGSCFYTGVYALSPVLLIALLGGSLACRPIMYLLYRIHRVNLKCIESDMALTRLSEKCFRTNGQ